MIGGLKMFSALQRLIFYYTCRLQFAINVFLRSCTAGLYVVINTTRAMCVKIVWKGCESVWKKGTMWNQCWKKYKFTTSAFHMHVNFLIWVWNFVIHVKNFCHMCELFFQAFYYMWNLFIHVKQFCHACELQISHA